MSEIKIEITIPSYEYENWNDYHDGIEEVMMNLKRDIREDLISRYVRHFKIKSEYID